MNEDAIRQAVKDAVREEIKELHRADIEQLRELRKEMTQLKLEESKAQAELHEAEARRAHWIVDKHGPHWERHMDHFDAAIEKQNEVTARLAEAVMAIAQAVKFHGKGGA